MSPIALSSRDRNFIADLEELVACEDRGTLASLRRGLGKPPGTEAQMYPFVASRLPEDFSPREAEPYYLVAALYAWHQIGWEPTEDKRPTNFGASFARLAACIRQEIGRDVPSLERHFVAILASDREDLPHRLRHAVGLLRSRAIPVDWAMLLHDLRYWETEDHRVQRAWGEAFWGRAPRAAEDQEGETEADSESGETY